MSKILKTISTLLIGALVGFLGMLAILEVEVNFNFGVYAYLASIVILTVGAALVVFSIYCYFNIRKITKLDLSGDEEDAAEGHMYRKYTDASLSSTLAMLFSLTSLSITILTEQPVWILIAGIILTIFSSAMSFILPSLIHEMYPDRNLPSVSEKNYAEKLLKSSDDGEKYVMLGGLYKTYMMMNFLLLAAILLLLFYSMVTGTSQLFSIFTVVAILAITNTQYLLSIRNK